MISPGGRGVEDILLALADPTRRRILDTLATRGSGTATSLAGGLPVTRQAVVKHLAVLKRAGLVVGERVGREVVHQIRPQPLDIAARWMSELATSWELRLGAPKKIAESDAPGETAEGRLSARQSDPAPDHFP